MATKKASKKIEGPSAHDWRTTDQDEINRRRARAQTEEFRIANTDPRHPIFSNFRVQSGSGLTYSVEIRELRQRHFACECVDFRINGLGTCKHVEAVLLHLEARFKRLFQGAARSGTSRLDLVPDEATDSVRLLNGWRQFERSRRAFARCEPAAALSRMSTNRVPAEAPPVPAFLANQAVWCIFNALL